MKWKIGKFTRKSVLVLCSFVLLVLSTQAEDSKTKNRPFILIHSENIARDFTKTDLRWEWSCLGCSGTGSECKCGYSEDELGNLAPQIVFLRFYLFILDRGEWGKKDRETSMCGCLLHAPYWGPDLAHNPGMCPEWESNWRPFGLKAGTQSTEPHQPGPFKFFFGV